MITFKSVIPCAFVDNDDCIDSINLFYSTNNIFIEMQKIHFLPNIKS
jgi:hypothetical protein